MALHQIKHRFTHAVLFECNVPEEIESELRTRYTLEKATDAGTHLAGAYLAGAYLAGASLECSDLAGADLAGANLAGANLAGANLAGANLTGAYGEPRTLPAGWGYKNGLTVRKS